MKNVNLRLLYLNFILTSCHICLMEVYIRGIVKERMTVFKFLDQEDQL